MRKLSRPSVAILCSLAPATALGVVAGIVIASSKQSATLDQFMEVYSQIYAKPREELANGISYDTADVLNGNVTGTDTYNGTIYTLKSIKYDYWNSNEQKFAVGVFTNPKDPEPDGSCIFAFFPPEEERKLLEEYQTKFPNYFYEVTQDYISYTFKDSNNNVYYSEKINKYGYLEYEYFTFESKEGKKVWETSLTYNIPPHKISYTKAEFMKSYSEIYDKHTSDLGKYYAYDQEDIDNEKVSGTVSYGDTDPYYLIGIICNFKNKVITGRFGAGGATTQPQILNIDTNPDKKAEELEELENQYYPLYKISNNLIGYEFYDEDGNITNSLYINGDGYILHSYSEGRRKRSTTIDIQYTIPPHEVEH